MLGEKTIRRARAGVHRFALAVLCAGTLVLAGCGSTPAKSSGSTGYTPAMQGALVAANRIAVDLTTFTYRDLDAYYAKLEAEGTAHFKQTLETNRAVQTAYDKQIKVLSEGNVVASAAKASSSNDAVTILLFVDQRLRSVGAKSGLLAQVRMQMEMKYTGGRWVVDSAVVTGAPTTSAVSPSS